MLSFFKKFLYCSRGRHERDKRSVRHDGNRWVGTCRHCRKPLEKHYSGQWVERSAD